MLRFKNFRNFRNVHNFRNNRGVILITFALLLPIFLCILYYAIDYYQMMSSKNVVRSALKSSLIAIASNSDKSNDEILNIFRNKFVFELNPDNKSELRVINQAVAKQKTRKVCHFVCHDENNVAKFFHTTRYESQMSGTERILPKREQFFKNALFADVLSRMKINNCNITFQPYNTDGAYFGNVKFAKLNQVSILKPFFEKDGDYNENRIIDNRRKFIRMHNILDIAYCGFIEKKFEFTKDVIPNFFGQNSIFRNEKLKDHLWTGFVTKIYSIDSVEFDLRILNLEHDDDFEITGCAKTCQEELYQGQDFSYYSETNEVLKNNISIILKDVTFLKEKISDDKIKITGICKYSFPKFRDGKTIDATSSVEAICASDLKNKSAASIAIAIPTSAEFQVRKEINKFLTEISEKINCRVAVIPYDCNIRLQENLFHDLVEDQLPELKLIETKTEDPQNQQISYNLKRKDMFFMSSISIEDVDVSSGELKDSIQELIPYQDSKIDSKTRNVICYFNNSDNLSDTEIKEALFLTKFDEMKNEHETVKYFPFNRFPALSDCNFTNSSSVVPLEQDMRGLIYCLNISDGFEYNPYEILPFSRVDEAILRIAAINAFGDVANYRPMNMPFLGLVWGLRMLDESFQKYSNVSNDEKTLILVIDGREIAEFSKNVQNVQNLLQQTMTHYGMSYDNSPASSKNFTENDEKNFILNGYFQGSEISDAMISEILGGLQENNVKIFIIDLRSTESTTLKNLAVANVKYFFVSAAEPLELILQKLELILQKIKFEIIYQGNQVSEEIYDLNVLN